jgi:hypothetical protein
MGADMNRDHRRLTRRGFALLLAAAIPVVAMVARDAGAKVTFSSPYTKEQTYNAALRMIRVDLGHKITERDPDAAYILFEYTSRESGTRVTPGSIEMIQHGDAVTVIVQLPQMPTYHEEVMAEHLRRKMQNEYGEPPRKSPPPPPPSTPDAGADSGKGDNHPD